MDVQAERLEGVRELVAAPAYVSGSMEDLDRRRTGHEDAGPRNTSTIYADIAGKEGSTRLLPALDEPAFDEKQVQPALRDPSLRLSHEGRIGTPLGKVNARESGKPGQTQSSGGEVVPKPSSKYPIIEDVARLLLAVCAIALLAACGGDQKQSASASDVLTKAGQATSSVRTFHFRLDHENGSTPMPLNLQLVSAEGDVAVPDRLAADVRAKASSVTASIKVISIGDKTWITNPFTRRWQLLPGGSLKEIADPAALMSSIVNGLKEPRVVGEPEVDGIKTYEIAGVIDAGALKAALPIAQPGHRVAVQLWVGVADSLPRKARLEGPLTDDEAPNIVREVEFSKFNAAVNIQPPE